MQHLAIRAFDPLNIALASLPRIGAQMIPVATGIHEGREVVLECVELSGTRYERVIVDGVMLHYRVGEMLDGARVEHACDAVGRPAR